MLILSNSPENIVSVQNLSKTYDSGLTALDNVNLEINRGEILALLGPNGAGKTTLISIICGIVRASSGSVLVDGYDIRSNYRKARSKIGLVPQEITLPPFEKVADTVNYSRGLYGKPTDHQLLFKLLKRLSLSDKKSAQLYSLSGGMKRRVLIAKALIHQPPILFLDEPTAGVDVELRKDMWELVHSLKDDGVTIILTTHYIEEAESIADRIGIINKGEIVLVEEKQALLERLGRKDLRIELQEAIKSLPESLKQFELELSADGNSLVYTYTTHGNRTGITTLLNEVKAAGLNVRDIQTHQSSLEEIFVDLLREQK